MATNYTCDICDAAADWRLHCETNVIAINGEIPPERSTRTFDVCSNHLEEKRKALAGVFQDTEKLGGIKL